MTSYPVVCVVEKHDRKTYARDYAIFNSIDNPTFTEGEVPHEWRKEDTVSFFRCEGTIPEERILSFRDSFENLYGGIDAVAIVGEEPHCILIEKYTFYYVFDEKPHNVHLQLKSKAIEERAALVSRTLINPEYKGTPSGWNYLLPDKLADKNLWVMDYAPDPEFLMSLWKGYNLEKSYEQCENLS